MACRCSFQSCHEENDPNPMSGLDLDSNKLECATSCWANITDPTFLRTFWGFLSLIPQFLLTNTRVVESITGLVLVKHLHKATKCFTQTFQILLVALYG